MDDFRLASFDSPAAFHRDHYLVFTLRCDRRRIPAALFKAHLRKAEEDFLSANPGFHKVPKNKREELTEAVRGTLLSRTLPTPTLYDAVWDTRSGKVLFASLGAKAVELFEALF
ncbi:MAG: exonuclease, partial [Desulfuromonadales bacterium]